MATALSEAGFEVWQAEDYDEAVALLHASARKLVVIVGVDNVPVLRFAACDRRLVHHHIYIAVEAPGLSLPEELCRQFPYLCMFALVSPSFGELTQAVTKAAQMLGGAPAPFPELAMR
jgi:hypothetical protein